MDWKILLSEIRANNGNKLIRDQEIADIVGLSQASVHRLRKGKHSQPGTWEAGQAIIDLHKKVMRRKR